MSGEFNGTQHNVSEILGRKVPFIPCQAHRINTVLNHSCNASFLIFDMFSIMQELYIFFSYSTKRFGTLFTKLNEIENTLQLKNLFNPMDGSSRIRQGNLVIL
jgi:hypothetical protein